MAVADPVRRHRDSRLDPASAQIGTVLEGVVRLVSAHAVRTLARTARPWPGHPDRFQDRLELWGVATLPGRDHDRQRLLALLNGESVRIHGRRAHTSGSRKSAAAYRQNRNQTIGIKRAALRRLHSTGPRCRTELSVVLV
ncbi:hypothetical protein GCM10010121_090080 [Streptomyces brasiliensis]|uniref:Uncharacterized protein n=1 Tax=Streptomyces brasiliensis TaxID=1954 RepID=A0A917UL05_9ACTN|nr:hypothetical protein GCM10010121_090080 [Streptomyces brasiliensis]